MKLLFLKVNNFRAINGDNNVLEFKDNNIVFLFGKNNIGKSSFLHAYQYFTSSSKKALITDFFQQNPENFIEIEASFLKEESDEENLNNKGLNKWISDSGIARFKKTWSEVGGTATKQTFDFDENTYVDGGFGGFDTILTNALPNIVFIEAMPSAKSLTDWLDREIKNKFLKNLKDNHQNEYQEALKAIKSLQDKVEGEGYLGDISKKANKYFNRTFPDLQLNISATPYKEADLSKSFEKDFSVTISDKSEEELLADAVEASDELINREIEGAESRKFDLHGHGLIRQAIINILSLFKDTKDGEKHIILFEEPEIYLHPSNKRKFRDTLYEIAEQEDFQIICVSHDPQLIDLSREHTSLARFVKQENNQTVIYQAGDDVFAKDTDTKQNMLMLNRFNPHVCESFFADEVILVEGDTEAIILRELLSKKQPGNEIFVLNTGTKNNIPFFVDVLSHFKIMQHIIHDSDERYLYKDKQRRLKKDGKPKKNSAWSLNDSIWKAIEKYNDKDLKIKRYVSVRNFEHAHDYIHNKEKGKPLSAFEFAQNIDINDDTVPIVKFINQILGIKPIEIDFSQDWLDENVKEPY